MKFYVLRRVFHPRRHHKEFSNRNVILEPFSRLFKANVAVIDFPLSPSARLFCGALQRSVNDKFAP